MTDGVQQHPSVTRIGVIGLGAMGRPMAGRLLKAHGALLYVSRGRRHDDLEAQGARRAATGRELAASSDVILAMLPDLPQLEDALAGDDGMLAGVAAPLLLMIGSTSSPPAVRELGARLKRETEGLVRVIDCPVSGGEDGARAGALSIMLGGDGPDAEVASRVLSACGHPVHLGPLGAGQVAKACNQLVVASTMLALAEATVLAERSGIGPDVLWELLGRGYAGGNLLRSRRDKLVSRDYSPSGIARYMIKDLGFADDVAGATQTRPVILPVVRDAFEELVARGFGEEDITVARRFIEER